MKRMAKQKQSGKSKAQMNVHKKPKNDTLDKPGASVVRGSRGSKSREKRLRGKAL